MKVVILAGGFGTRLSEQTSVRPKPMVEIGDEPILWHIMKIYHGHGFNEFVICCGYKGYQIKEPVLNEDGTVKEEGTSAEEMAGYYNEFNTEKREELKKAISEENKELIEALKSEMQENRDKQAENLSQLIKSMGEMGLAIKRIHEVQEGDVSLTGNNSLDSELKAVKEDLSVIKDKRGGTVTIKVPDTMTITGNVSGGNVPVEQRLPGLNRIQRVQTRIRNFVNQGVALSNVISWVEQQNPDPLHPPFAPAPNRGMIAMLTKTQKPRGGQLARLSCGL